MGGKIAANKRRIGAWPKRLGNSTLFGAIALVLGTIVLPVTIIALPILWFVNRRRGRKAKARQLLKLHGDAR